MQNAKNISRARSISDEEAVERKKTRASITKTFGLVLPYEEDEQGRVVKDLNDEPVRRERFVTKFVQPTPWTPVVDHGYVFPYEETIMTLMAIENRAPFLITGPTGVGKTSTITQIAARLNYSVVRIGFDGGVTRPDLVGEWIFREGQGMSFNYGILPRGFEMPGTIILLDEWDAIGADCAFVLQRPLERDDPKLLILENGGELIPLHADNVIAATANTIGMGDDSGLYGHGTSVQNFAQLNRFAITVQLDYLPEEEERGMLLKRLPDLKAHEVAGLVKTAHLIREAFKADHISVPLSPRDLINWADHYLQIGDPFLAAKYCFLNRMPTEDATTVEQILRRNIDA